MEQLSRAAPFFKSEAQKSHLFFCAERALFERYPLVDAWRRAFDLQTYHPLLGLHPCASFPLVTFFRRRSYTYESATAAEVGTLLRSW